MAASKKRISDGGAGALGTIDHDPTAAAAPGRHGAEGGPDGTPAPKRRRRQIGADRRTQPNPAVPAPASARSLALGRLALTVTVVAWVAYVFTVVQRVLFSTSALTVRSLCEAVGYLVIVTFLAVSAGAYLITRQGYLRRTRSHTRVPRAELEAQFEMRSPSATVLIPSYREQPEVIRQTMLSAALQEFPDLRVVLLIDDPPRPENEQQQALLDQARAVPGEIAAMLEAPRARFTESLAQADRRRRARGDAEPTADDLSALADDYEHAAAWLESLAATWVRHDHTDDFFVDQVVLILARDLSVVATAIRGAVLHRSSVSADRARQLQQRLTSIFGAELTSFERKQHITLSAEPSKAMNLNGYIGLMGGSYCEQHTSAGCLLLPCQADDPDATLHVPGSDYILTLDADSVLLPEYCLRLVYAMEQPGNERIGVIQTPYSAYPGAPTRVERLAGATTDIQHIVHQGMAEYEAAFWVGANAVLRTAAVEELRVEDADEGRVVSRFISDRTVIEDTESTLDLTAKGWRVVNYPERLAYSASPPDFGALCIQRQRWANGGLLILGKLGAHWRAKKARGEKRNLVELVLRLNYLASISWATAGLALLLVYPFSSHLMSTLVLVMSAPYFAVMASDLKRCGYKHTDVFRIYGFNLIMLPVNAAGVLRSVGQMITGHKSAFARTPKVRHRSVAPVAFVLSPYLIVLLSAFALAADIQAHRWPHAVFAGTNLFLAVPATIAIIGLRNSMVDVSVGFVQSLYKPERPGPAAPILDPVVDWAAVLYHGSTDKPRAPHRPATAGITITSAPPTLSGSDLAPAASFAPPATLAEATTLVAVPLPEQELVR